MSAERFLHLQISTFYFNFVCVATVLQKQFLVKLCYLTEASTAETALYSDQEFEKNFPKRLRQLQKKWFSSVASRVPEPWMPAGPAAHPPQESCPS